MKFYFNVFLVFIFSVFSTHSFAGIKESRKDNGLTLSFDKEVNSLKKFVFVVPSFNNSRYCKKNLTSILSQNYENFRVIYIDDASTDDTYNKVEELIELFGATSRVTLLQNEENQGAGYNIFKAIQLCDDDEIVCIVDGDDWLFHENVLQNLNYYYADPNVWLTYGQFINYPSCKKGDSRPLDLKILQQARIRRSPLMTWHSRTFYAGLFKKIRVEDFLYQGEFIKVAVDTAAMFAMIELAREHAYYLDEVLYVYNTVNPIRNSRVFLEKKDKVTRYLRTLPIYESLKNHPAGHFP